MRSIKDIINWITTKNGFKDLCNVLLLLAILIISIFVFTDIFSLFITNNVIVCILTLLPVLLFEFPIGMLWLSKVIVH